MSERLLSSLFREGRATIAGSPLPAEHGFWWKAWLVVKFLQARLRFVVILLAVGGTIVYWDTLRAYYEKWTRPAAEEAAAAGDVEYWCPMHPTVVRDRPDKCPICGMPLSRRKRIEGGEEALKAGTISRVSFSPYRVALAGIQTAEVGYQPLTRDVTAAGFVEFDETRLARITARATGKSRIDKLFVNVTGQSVRKGDPLALLYSPELVVTVHTLLDAQRNGDRDQVRLSRDRLALWGIDSDQIDEILRSGKPITHLTIRAPFRGHVIRKYQVEGDYVEEGAPLYDVADLHSVWIEAEVYEDEVAFLEGGLPVSAVTRTFPDRVFRGTLAFIHPHLNSSTRTLTVRFTMDNPNHDLRPGMYATVRFQVPATRLQLFSARLAEDWRDRTGADVLAHSLLAPSGLTTGSGLGSLLEGAIRHTLSRRELLLAVPEGAVIDTGSRKIVYREAEPNVFEGVEVELGPRCGAFYPVVRGLRAGERVATEGSFLIDAETRLTAGAGSTYFGASGGPQEDRHAAATVRPSMSPDEEDRLKANLAGLSPEERALVVAQGYCPIQEANRLGSMGVPVKVLVQGQPVFLCCKGCVNQALDNPKRTLDRVAELKARGKSSPPPGASPAPVASGGPERGDARVRANLARLSPEERKLAEAQKDCPIQGNRLGQMGVPVKVMIEGRPVFLCCKGCKKDALEHPDQTLARVEELEKANTAPPSP